MKKTLLILIVFSQTIRAQVNVFDRTYFSYEIEDGLAKNQFGPSAAATMYSLQGDYLNAVFLSEIDVSWGMDTVDMSQCIFTSAYDRILKYASKHQVVIISEAHLKPQHRIFAKKLLVGLKELGFEYLGMETLSSLNNDNDLLDTLIHKRGFPLNSQITGGYTLEPKMGDLVRQALANGYKLFAYEYTQPIKGVDRDQIQAENVIRFLKKIGSKKMVIVCGFHHVIEGGMKKRGTQRWMANIIKDSLGIDPLTIYQDNFTEKFISEEHNVLNKGGITEVSVCVDDKSNIIKWRQEVDIEVIHPKTKFVNGRPDWLKENPDYKEVDIPVDSITMEFPMIISAYIASEYDKGVPLDRVELKSKYVLKPLILSSGDYVIELKNLDELKTFNITVK
ncbi:MAG: hypothetical protein KDC49_02360 [Saprospiraceae bacterium]|nr:hypothetical protein [Saprospiraceae bacterium]